MGKVIPRYNSCYIRLSTGSFADMNTCTIEEAVDCGREFLNTVDRIMTVLVN